MEQFIIKITSSFFTSTIISVALAVFIACFGVFFSRDRVADDIDPKVRDKIINFSIIIMIISWIFLFSYFVQ